MDDRTRRRLPGKPMPRLRDIAPEGIIDARDGRTSRFIEDRTFDSPTRTLRRVAARGWTITPVMGHDAMRSFRLEGPMTGGSGGVAVVTGAASGIGRAAAAAFHRRGATVFAMDVNRTGLADLRSGSGDPARCITRVVDVSSAPEVESAFAQVAEAVSWSTRRRSASRRPCSITPPRTGTGSWLST